MITETDDAKVTPLVVETRPLVELFGQCSSYEAMLDVLGEINDVMDKRAE
jgi:hypothetical protein